MPLGVLMPAPAITIIFLHFSSLIKFAMSCMDDTENELSDLCLVRPPCFLFWGDTLFPLCGGDGQGLMDRFLNEDTSPESEWLFFTLALLFREPLTRLAFLVGPVLEICRCCDFFGDTGGRGVRHCIDRRIAMRDNKMHYSICLLLCIAVHAQYWLFINPFQMWCHNLWTGGQDKIKLSHCNEIHSHAIKTEPHCSVRQFNYIPTNWNGSIQLHDASNFRDSSVVYLRSKSKP